MDRLKNILKVKGAAWLLVMFVFILAGTFFTMNKVFAADPGVIAKLTPDSAKAVAWGFVAAAVSVCVGSISAAVALAYIGSAAMGAMSEKPEVAGKAIVFAGLAEGIAIYGLIIAIMILAKI